MSESAVEALAEEVTRGEVPADPSSGGGEARPKPVSGWDRYEIGVMLGSGGMGSVYKAYDPILKRFVALKFLLGDNPQSVKRFLREAQAQARIDHEHVCKIYEVGEAQGKPFISMQYIEGRTLGQVAGELTTGEKVVLMRQVSEAVHAAHRIGIIHRDLKPANVMVERTEDGAWRPYVTDFGLAREAAAEGMTATGLIMGTPAYMSPEQALGEAKRMDRRSDVYSLGATFYELLAGAPPFRGTGLDILVRMTQEDAPTLRKLGESIPEELETIVMKCLEKDPERRYESARALADDLQRYLDGEPIVARPATWTYRAVKKARKHKVASVSIAVGVVAVLAALGIWLDARWAAAKRAVLAQRLGQQIEKFEGTLRQIYMLPLHDVRRETATVHQAMESSAKQITKEMGQVGEAPGEYALGRIELALHQYGRAREHLEKARALGYRDPEVAYALGQVLGELYQEQMEKASRIGDKEQREAQRREIRKKYREPALQYLAASRQLAVDSPEYAAALIDYYSGRNEAALVKARASFERMPWLYEAKTLEGDILTRQGDEKRERGDVDGASALYRQAETAYAASIRIGESDVLPYRNLCGVCTQEFYMEMRGAGRAVEELKDKADAACDKALAIDPDRADVLVKAARVQWLWADYIMRRGQDPREHLTRAENMLQAALRRDPQDSDAHTNLAVALWQRAKYEGEHGADFVPLLRPAMVSARKAVELEPRSEIAQEALGLVAMDLGVGELDRGGDPRDALGEAATCFSNAVDLGPGLTRPLINLGLTYLVLGQYESAHGEDPRASLNRAADALERAISRNTMQIYAHRFLSESYRRLAGYEWTQGRDPTRLLDRADAAVAGALRLDATDLISNLEAAFTSNLRAELEIDGDRPPSRDLARARDAEGRAMATDPTMSTTYQLIGSTEILAARWSMRRGLDPAAAFATARAALQKGARLNVRDYSVTRTLAELHRWRAEWLWSRHRKPDQDIQEGLRWVETTLAINPSDAEAFAIRGVLLGIRSRGLAESPQRAETRQAAKAALERATALNVNLGRKYAQHHEELDR